MNGKKTLGVITARGGSKGLPRKNVLPLRGKPLIAWTMEAARDAQLLDKVILSTDDEEIADVARQWKIEVPFIRPAELATDTSHHPDVMIHATKFMREELGEGFDAVMCLQPTVPFRKAEHIDQAIGQFYESGAECLISLKAQDYPPWWMFELDGSRIKPAFEFKQGVNVFNLERQQFPKVYRPNGAIYITAISDLEANGRMVNPENCSYYLMDEKWSVDIDTAIDLATAEAMLKLAN